MTFAKEQVTANQDPSADRLDELLTAAGSPYRGAELDDLLRGVNAAPIDGEDESWMMLVAREPDEALKELLRARRAALAAAFDDGLDDPRPDTAARVRSLREELARQGLDGFVIPRADEHQGEYVPRRAQRLAYVTGFTGSAGMAIVLAERAAVFVDGRYTLQAQTEVDGAVFERRHVTKEPATDWLAEVLGEGARLGFDPWLHTKTQIKRLKAACDKAGAVLVPVEDDPVDVIWRNQAPAPLAPVVPHALEYAGESSIDKRDRLAETLAESGAAAAFLSMPDSIAWLLNLRGGDVPCTPLPLSYALLRADASVDLFVDGRKLTDEAREALDEQVRINLPEALGPALDGLTGEQVLVDPATAPVWVSDRLAAAGATVVDKTDPCQLPKARKNAVELQGARNAHRRDGAALVRFLAWLAREAPGGRLTELDAVEHLYRCRSEDPLFRTTSFDTISGAGPNGAVVHYRVTPQTSRRLEPGMLYLVDSGGQYLDGTTDVTRTVAVGAPTDEQRDRFTRVLKGHIALATARFPEGTSGGQLDVLARQYLWQAGLDYDHGTGHGVGSYLGVHEGPQRISRMGAGDVALEAGMVVSNEPGYYKTGAYGIRIENLVAVVPADDEAGAVKDDERKWLAFETLTKAPIDRNLIDRDLLSADEAAWLDAYHAEVRAALTPLLDDRDAAWLAEATRPLSEG